MFVCVCVLNLLNLTAYAKKVKYFTLFCFKMLTFVCDFWWAKISFLNLIMTVLEKKKIRKKVKQKRLLCTTKKVN